jgi:hypothetical protein
MILETLLRLGSGPSVDGPFAVPGPCGRLALSQCSHTSGKTGVYLVILSDR